MNVYTLDDTSDQLGAYKANYSIFDNLFAYAQRLLNISPNYIKIYSAPSLGYFSIGTTIEYYNTLIGQANNIEELLFQSDFPSSQVAVQGDDVFLQQNNLVFLNYTFPALGLFNQGLSNSILYTGCLIEKIEGDYFISNLIGEDKRNSYSKDVELLHRILSYYDLPFDYSGDSPFQLWGKAARLGSDYKNWYLLLPSNRANEVDPRLYQTRVVGERREGFFPLQQEIPLMNDQGNLELVSMTSCYIRGISGEVLEELKSDYFRTFNHDYILDDTAFSNFKTVKEPIDILLKDSNDIEMDTLLQLATHIVDPTSTNMQNFANTVAELNAADNQSFHWFYIPERFQIKYRYFGTQYRYMSLNPLTPDTAPRDFELMLEAETIHRIIWLHWYQIFSWQQDIDLAQAVEYYHAIDMFIGTHLSSYKDMNYPIALYWDWANNRVLVSINLGYLTPDDKFYNYWMDLDTWDFTVDDRGNTVGGNGQAALKLLWKIINTGQNNLTEQELSALEMYSEPQPPRPEPTPMPIQPLYFEEKVLESGRYHEYPEYLCDFGYYIDDHGRRYSYFFDENTGVMDLVFRHYWDDVGFEPVCQGEIIPEPEIIPITDTGEDIGDIFQREWFILLLIALFLFLVLRERK